ncbi:MAG: lysophospholipid acyltransferase family protein [Acidimicrobiales bacterium]
MLRAPTRPLTAEARPLDKRTGVDYETSWARRYPARLARAVVLDDLTVPAVWALARPKVIGRDPMERIEGPIIVSANHASHLDTAVLLASLPVRRRHHTVVAAAADYFFDRRWKAALWAFGLGAIPMERMKASRRSADAAAELIEQGWSLVIFPEGGRSPYGWGQEFKGGAAYLAKRCGVPVVPVHIRGTRAILPKSGAVRARLRPGQVEVRFGFPLRPADGEDARRFSARIEQAVALLADEAESDWWTARQRASRGETPPFRGPDSSPWRRAWSLPESGDPADRRAADGAPSGVAVWPSGTEGRRHR